MSEKASQSQAGVLRRHWWVLAIVVLALLVGIVYLLSHLSAADSEMYPTTMLEENLTNLHLLC